MVFNKNVMNKLLYLITLPLLIACASSGNRKNQDTEMTESISTYNIAPYRVSCVGVAPMQCLLVRKSPSDNWEYFYSAIKGFEHKPGTEYMIKVKEVQLENVPADASSISYELVEIIESKSYAPKAINLHDIWGVIELNGINPLASQCEQTIELNLNEGTALGKAGCNNFRAEFETTDNSNIIVFKNIIGTKKTCPNQTLEDTYLKALASVDAYFRFNQNLYLISENKPVIKLRRMD